MDDGRGMICIAVISCSLVGGKDTFFLGLLDDANDIVDDVDKLFVEDSNRLLLLLLC